MYTNRDEYELTKQDFLLFYEMNIKFEAIF